MKRPLLGVVCLLTAALASAPLAFGPQTPTAETTTVVEKYLASTGRQLTSYRAFRRLEAASRGGKLAASLEAWTSLDPVKGFEYSIAREEGSSLIRSKVLHAALEAERTMRASGEADRAAIDRENYDFTTTSVAEDGLLQVSLRPKRSDKASIEGRVLLSPDDADLVRVEGMLVKRPSFWTRKVEVVRRYARLQGVRVPVAMQSTAQVLFIGTSTFTMHYDYESINGDRVKTRSGGEAPPRVNDGRRSDTSGG